MTITITYTSREDLPKVSAMLKSIGEDIQLAKLKEKVEKKGRVFPDDAEIDKNIKRK